MSGIDDPKLWEVLGDEICRAVDRGDSSLPYSLSGIITATLERLAAEDGEHWWDEARRLMPDRFAWGDEAPRERLGALDGDWIDDPEVVGADFELEYWIEPILGRFGMRGIAGYEHWSSMMSSGSTSFCRIDIGSRTFVFYVRQDDEGGEASYTLESVEVDAGLSTDDQTWELFKDSEVIVGWGTNETWVAVKLNDHRRLELRAQADGGPFEYGVIEDYHLSWYENDDHRQSLAWGVAADCNVSVDVARAAVDAFCADPLGGGGHDLASAVGWRIWEEQTDNVAPAKRPPRTG